MDASRIVLVPTDFSDASFAALEYAVYYANRSDIVIRLLHVANKEELRQKTNSVNDYRQRIRQLQDQLKEFRNLSGGAFRIKTELLITPSPVAETILRYAAGLEIELCCIGTSGLRTEHQVGEMGIHTSKLIHEASFPILTCRQAPGSKPFRNILMPIDLTRHTNQKVDRIVHFARSFGSTIHLLAVSEFLEEFTFSRKELIDRLEEAAAHIRQEGIKCYTEIIRYDQVSKSVLDYAIEINADLLVVMSENQYVWNKWLFGDRTSKVVAQSPIPVLSFRPQ